MLENHCQCPNTATADSDMCLLHKEFETEQAIAVEQEKIENMEKQDAETAQTNENIV
jgi:hypothetical protein